MAIVVVGGHTRNIGKTTLATAILRALPHLRWTAMKITQFGHGVCSANGEPCHCETGDHTLAISEERSRDSGSDTARLLNAGAERVLWVRTRQGQLAEAMPRLRREMVQAEHVLLESNSVLRFLKPDLYLAVLQPSVADFKASALRYLDRADALFVPEGASLQEAHWQGISPALWRGKTVFPLAEDALNHEATLWLQERLDRIVTSEQKAS